MLLDLANTTSTNRTNSSYKTTRIPSCSQTPHCWAHTLSWMNSTHSPILAVSTHAVTRITYRTTRRLSWLCATWRIRGWLKRMLRGQGDRNNSTRKSLSSYSPNIAKIITSNTSKGSMRLSHHLCTWCKRLKGQRGMRRRRASRILIYDSFTTVFQALYIAISLIFTKKRSFSHFRQL